MMLKRFSTTLRAGAIAALFVVGTSAAAYAAPLVVFTTTGAFGAGGNSVTFTSGVGTATVVFSGTTNSHDLDRGFSNTNYGDFLLSTSGEFSGTASSPFVLSINQSSPTTGSSTLPAQLTGSFVSVLGATGETDFRVDFTTTSTTIDGVGYTIQPSYFLVPPPSGSGGTAAAGTTTIQGRITAQPTVVPEPATMILLGTGLLAAFRARRKIGLTNDN